MGNDTTITLAGQAGNFEINVTIPLIAYNLLQSIELLASAARLLAEKCVRDLSVDRQRCEAYVDQSLALVTGLVPLIGYDRAADLAKQAYESGKTIRQTALEAEIATEQELDQLLKPNLGAQLIRPVQEMKKTTCQMTSTNMPKK